MIDDESSDLEMPSFRLDDKLALVTGAGRGLGAAIATGFAQAGAEVVLLGRTRSYLEELSAKIGVGGGRSRVVECDVTDDKALRNAIATLPGLDIVVNNAGTNFPEPFVDVSDEHLDTMLDLNVRACFVVAQACVKKMLEHPSRADKGGVVINISSQMGHVGSPNRTVYCMTKQGNGSRAGIAECPRQQHRPDIHGYAAGAQDCRHTGETRIHHVAYTDGKTGDAGRHRRGSGLPRFTSSCDGYRYAPDC